jgi:hypothetical protein
MLVGALPLLTLNAATTHEEILLFRMSTIFMALLIWMPSERWLV